MKNIKKKIVFIQKRSFNIVSNSPQNEPKKKCDYEKSYWPTQTVGHALSLYAYYNSIHTHICILCNIILYNVYRVRHINNVDNNVSPWRTTTLLIVQNSFVIIIVAIVIIIITIIMYYPSSRLVRRPQWFSRSTPGRKLNDDGPSKTRQTVASPRATCTYYAL